jgi:hypothetical protein
MKAIISSAGIILIMMFAGILISGCTFDTSGIAFPKDTRFDGCWENIDLDEIWGKVIVELKQHDVNLLTGILFVRAESIATIIPFSLEGEVESDGLAVLHATLHATPNNSVGVVVFLPVPPTPVDTMTFQMVGKPPSPPLSECP